jgi:hypothetical protein
VVVGEVVAAEDVVEAELLLDLEFAVAPAAAVGAAVGVTTPPLLTLSIFLLLLVALRRPPVTVVVPPALRLLSTADAVEVSAIDAAEDDDCVGIAGDF